MGDDASAAIVKKKFIPEMQQNTMQKVKCKIL